MVLVALQPRFQIKVQQYTVRHYIVWYQMKQLNSMETLFFFIFNMIKCDSATWLARQKVDQSNPQSVWALSVDLPLFQARPLDVALWKSKIIPLFPLPKGAVWFTFSPSQPPMAEIPVLSGSCFSFKILAFQVLHPLRIWMTFMGWVWIF